MTLDHWLDENAWNDDVWPKLEAPPKEEWRQIPGLPKYKMNRVGAIMGPSGKRLYVPDGNIRLGTWNTQRWYKVRALLLATWGEDAAA